LLSSIMIQIRCSAFLFDMDGVLIDSTPAVARVWRRWAVAHGFDPAEVVARAHGRPSIATLRDYLPGANHETLNREIERQEMDDLEGVLPLPGARELLTHIPADRWTIVTSSTRPLAEVRLRAAGLPIPQLMITSNDITNGKPHPEPYLRAAERLGFQSAECLVVEDAPSGIRAGKAAGARVIAFTTTAAAEELKHAGADWILKNCADISIEAQTEGINVGLANNR